MVGKVVTGGDIRRALTVASGCTGAVSSLSHGTQRKADPRLLHLMDHQTFPKVCLVMAL